MRCCGAGFGITVVASLTHATEYAWVHMCVCVRALQAVCALAHALLRLDAAEWTPVLESASGPCTPAFRGRG